ncbi:hypothetical protein AB0L47_30420 [Streptomyces bobili]|uniref:hypothetical protein n=1 Tax=Streptomyces bobili TaxID=67280 RepID=UPI00344ACBA4
MSITGWRVHFTRRDLAWPREVSPFMREFDALFDGLDQRLDDLGVREAQPFLISPAVEYDLALRPGRRGRGPGRCEGAEGRVVRRSGARTGPT